MQTLTQIRAMLAERGLSPRHALGQHFLIERPLIARLCEAAGLAGGGAEPAPWARVVLEVGPGTGALTEELLARGARVVACELDAGLAALLRDRLGGHERFALIEGDCLERGRAVNRHLIGCVRRAVAAAPGAEGFSLVANLPYQAGTALLLALLLHHPECARLAVTIQREVAQRLAAGPGSKAYGVLGIVAGAVAQVEVVATLPPECFWPRPEVTSAMVLITRRPRPLTADAPGLAAMAKALFSARRKQLGTVLGRSFPWPAGIRPDLRPEQVGVEGMVALLEAGAGQRLAGAGEPSDSATEPAS
jgi:16S rRNA (adenine1518-N6/adenine1519-N6)-dimethyltransferase